jgi:prevent-host-death family protein
MVAMKRKRFQYPPAGAESMVIKESAALGRSDLIVSVRTAKDQLSHLLERAAQGDEVIITSGGQPKAKLIPVRSGRRFFRMDWALLRSMPKRPSSPPAEELVREDRDARG